jgi:hypothetical protein
MYSKFDLEEPLNVKGDYLIFVLLNGLKAQMSCGARAPKSLERTKKWKWR